MQIFPAQMRTRTPKRAKLTSIVLFVKSQSTLPPNWKHITAVQRCFFNLKAFTFVTGFRLLLLLLPGKNLASHCSLSTRHKAQADPGRSHRSASTQRESGDGSRQLQEQAARQQRQHRGAQQEPSVWSVWDHCELWDTAYPGKAQKKQQVILYTSSRSLFWA